MSTLKRLPGKLHLFVLWALLSVVGWSFVFGLATDAAPAHKVSLYIDAPALDSVELSAVLEERTALPGGVRMVRARLFSYAMMDDGGLQNADLYILPASKISLYLEDLAPAPTALQGGRVWAEDGVVYGLRVYDRESGAGAAAAYIGYLAPGLPEEDYYLFFGKNGLHLEGLPGARDNAAALVAASLLALD